MVSLKLYRGPIKFLARQTYWVNFDVAKWRDYVSLKLLPDGRNMSTQHIGTLLDATCCVRLATVLRRVACCMLDVVCSSLKWSKLSQQHPTCRNTSQHCSQTHATCCVQQCCDMLCWHVAIVWPGLKFLISSVNQAINQSINQSIKQSINQSVNLYLHSLLLRIRNYNNEGIKSKS